VTIFSDSRYLVDGIQRGWAKRWGLTLNCDLWEQLMDLCQQHEVIFHWVRGHSGDVDNEACDRLAREAALESDLPVDEEYEERTLSAAERARQGILFQSETG
jgi:ribonuclease HI